MASEPAPTHMKITKTLLSLVHVLATALIAPLRAYISIRLLPPTWVRPDWIGKHTRSAHHSHREDGLKRAITQTPPNRDDLLQTPHGRARSTVITFFVVNLHEHHVTLGMRQAVRPPRQVVLQGPVPLRSSTINSDGKVHVSIFQ